MSSKKVTCRAHPKLHVILSRSSSETCLLFIPKSRRPCLDWNSTECHLRHSFISTSKSSRLRSSSRPSVISDIPSSQLRSHLDFEVLLDRVSSQTFLHLNFKVISTSKFFSTECHLRPSFNQLISTSKSLLSECRFLVLSEMSSPTTKSLSLLFDRMCNSEKSHQTTLV